MGIEKTVVTTMLYHIAMVHCDSSSRHKMVLPISDCKSHGGGSRHAIGKMMDCPMQDKSGHVAGKHICRKHPLHVPTFASGFVASIFFVPWQKSIIDMQRKCSLATLFCPHILLLICHFLCFSFVLIVRTF